MSHEEHKLPVINEEARTGEFKHLRNELFDRVERLHKLLVVRDSTKSAVEVYTKDLPNNERGRITAKFDPLARDYYEGEGYSADSEKERFELEDIAKFEKWTESMESPGMNRQGFVIKSDGSVCILKTIIDEDGNTQPVDDPTNDVDDLHAQITAIDQATSDLSAYYDYRDDNPIDAER